MMYSNLGLSFLETLTLNSFVYVLCIKKNPQCTIVYAEEFLRSPGVYGEGWAVYLPPYPNLLHLYQHSLTQIRWENAVRWHRPENRACTAVILLSVRLYASNCTLYAPVMGQPPK